MPYPEIQRLQRAGREALLAYISERAVELQPKALLDAPCGEGDLVLRLAACASLPKLRFLAVDRSIPSSTYTAVPGDRARFIQGELPDRLGGTAGGSQDLICCIAGAVYFTEWQCAALLREFARLLTKAGELLLSFAHVDWSRRYFELECAIEPDEERHHVVSAMDTVINLYLRGHQRYRRICERAGLRLASAQVIDCDPGVPFAEIFHCVRE